MKVVDMPKAKTLDPALEQTLKIRAAKAWRPDEGDMVSGTVITLLKRDNGEFKPYPVVILNTGEPGYVAVHAFHTLLFEQLKEIKAKAGDEFTIVYEGRVTSKKLDSKGEPRTYHNYILVSNGETAEVEFTWDTDDADEIPA
jgi:hypothetical protein